MKSISFLSLALFLLCTCGPARPGEPSDPPQLGWWPEYPAYATLDGAPSLLLGFDLRGSQPDEPMLREILDRMRATRGTYLLLDPEPARLARALGAARRGIVLDTVPPVDSLPTVGPIALFNRVLLFGAPGAAFTEFTQAGLNAIRAVRTVELQVKFWDLHAEPELLSRNNPTSALGAADDAANYLLYIPSAGRVNVALRDGAQVPRRITVVGHLGTQRSEVLRPPYDRRFTLLSNDERGGWMVIKRLENASR